AIEMSEDLYRGRYGVGGVDLAETTDLCCATAMFPYKGKLYMVQRYFIAEARIEQNSKNDRMGYRTFCQTGATDPLNRELLQICPGPMVRKSDVTAWYDELTLKYGAIFWSIGYDRWHGGDWVDEMEQHGYPKQDNTGRGVTFAVAMGSKSLSTPTKEFRSLLQDRIIQYSRHNGLFRWCCSNTNVEIDASNEIRPVKGRGRAKYRIDGFMAALLAYMAYKQRQELFREYEDQG
ncbi:MAG TPA: terminase large subunit, partial [Bacillota bacterium]|nr:terminase large subunit [Bacillota bacterium]